MIAAELRSELMAGTLRPGAELSQVMLAERFGVSRIPIRDALRILAGEGLIEIEANRGARAITLTAAEVREIYDLRVLLECDALRRAAAHVAPAELEEIERVRRKSDLDAGTRAWAAGDWAFHRALYQPAGRPRQLAMIESLRRACRLHVSAYATMPAKKPRWLNDHRAIVEHLRKGDAQGAIQALQAHLEAAGRHLLERMAAAQD
ncbi:MAG: GntR family transcriptional regulator [Bradyrhizobium sp.]|uniref:GntR family transcriptional regulator n=1 Tax=Bradyrhizobium sp. TaxID=376 RepID=UPI001DEC352E|nr:GntR family transcriptional regulator [Bradyrhizobium sp.]MBV9563517.1 GntR family transcriptional regulator [Bradyrhizobium sp.]